MIADNQILAVLSADVLNRLIPRLNQVNLSQGEMLYRPGDPLTYLYFPIDCLISITITLQDGAIAP